jgi:peptide/nickel transport system permease protein
VDHLFLPALTLALTFLAVVVRSLRASISEILRADHVDAARLKGISRFRVFSRHVLRLASLPVVALVGLNMSYLLGTSVIVENVFALPGMGQQLVSSILQRDFLVVQGITLVFGLIVIVISTAVELIQAALDPRSAA